MPKVADQPEKLRPYLWHSVELGWRDGDQEAYGDCPLCGRAGKFTVSIESGQWRCFVCNEGTDNGKAIQGGNAYVFLRKLWELSYEATTSTDYRALADNRKLLQWETLLEWQVAKSALTGEWLVPGYSVEGKLTQLYSWLKKEDRRALIPTPTLGHALHGVNLYNPTCTTVWLMEGPWDGLALWEVLASGKRTGEGLVPTANREACLLSTDSVLAVPGCETFFDSWLPLFTGKAVNLCYDNDHPRTHPKTGQPIPPAGLTAMQRVAKVLGSSKHPPEAINWLRWADPEGYDLNLESGYDVRDLLTEI